MKKVLKTPKNQYQLVLWYLYNWNSVTMVNVITDSMFYKFNTRLSEIENTHGLISRKTKQYFINRFGRKSNYLIYYALDLNKIEELYSIL